MKKLFIATLTLLLLPVMAWAMDYNYISQNEMRDTLDTKAEVTIVDICPVDQFSKGHLPGSIETNAYPVKSDAERERLASTLTTLKASTDNIVIVCPGGGGGAKRTYDFYVANGIQENRLQILEKGMNGWPYQTESN